MSVLMTETSEPDEVMYQFQSYINTPCTSSKTPIELSRLIGDKAEHITSGLRCMKQNTCTLRPPNVQCCDLETIHQGNGSITRVTSVSLDCMDGNSRSRRGLVDESPGDDGGSYSKYLDRVGNGRGLMSQRADSGVVAVQVVLIYHGKPDQLKRHLGKYIYMTKYR